MNLNPVGFILNNQPVGWKSILNPPLSSIETQLKAHQWKVIVSLDPYSRIQTRTPRAVSFVISFYITTAYYLLIMRLVYSLVRAFSPQQHYRNLSSRFSRSSSQFFPRLMNGRFESNNFMLMSASALLEWFRCCSTLIQLSRRYSQPVLT